MLCVSLHRSAVGTNSISGLILVVFRLLSALVVNQMIPCKKFLQFLGKQARYVSQKEVSPVIAPFLSPAHPSCGRHLAGEEESVAIAQCIY